LSPTKQSFVPVILAGGSGTRLWPLSRSGYPKQFLSLGGRDSLLQASIKRFVQSSSASETALASVSNPDGIQPVVVCSEDHRFLTLEQLEAIDCRNASILLEPSSRNTAPAIAAAAWHISTTHPEAVMVVAPADHLIPDTATFQQVIAQAVQLAAQGALITLGIKPRGPETGYGYIDAGEQIEEAGRTCTSVRPVKCFIEKPSLEKAKQLIENPNCFWNAGIFVFKASSYLKALASLEPTIHSATRQAVQQAEADLQFLRLNQSAFDQCTNISVDYAVLEKSENVMVLPFEGSWSDIGSWDAVHKSAERDSQGNASIGDVLQHECTNTYLHASSRLVVAVGTNNISVIETPDAVLVIDNSNAQSIKAAYEVLKRQQRTELSTHTTCYRPWGHYESLKLHPRFQVKRIHVKPGAKLSLQKHFHRSEHWVVVRG